MGQAPGLASTHGIGLARQGEGTRTLLTDLSGQQMQVDQTTHHRGAFAPLVDPHRPEAEHPLTAVEELRHLPQPLFWNVAEPSNLARRPAGRQIKEGLVVLGVIVNEGRVLTVLAKNQMGQAVEQRQVRTRRNRQMHIRSLRGLREAGIDDDDLHAAGMALFAFQEALKQHRVAFRGVGPDQEGHRAVVQILVTGGRTIGAQAAGVARHRGAHAQAGVGIEVVRAQGTFQQLLGQVVVLGVELARSIHRNRIGPLGGQGAADAAHQQVHRLLPSDGLERFVQAGAVEGLAKPTTTQGLANGRALDADLAQARGVLAVTPSRPHGIALGITLDRLAGQGRWNQFKTTAHTAVGALAAHVAGGHHHNRNSVKRKKGRLSMAAPNRPL